MSIAYGLDPKFDVKDNPVYENIKKIVKRTRELNKIAGIHNGTTEYAKEMIDLGFQFITISSDLRSMKETAKNILKEIKLISYKGRASS